MNSFSSAKLAFIVHWVLDEFARPGRHVERTDSVLPPRVIQAKQNMAVLGPGGLLWAVTLH